MLSFTLRPVLQVPSPRSSREWPSLGARSKCPNGLVTVSAIQTQTGSYSSVPCRGSRNDGKTAVSPRTHLKRDVPRDPAPVSIRIILTAAHHLRLQKQSPRSHLMRSMSADLRDRQTSRQNLRTLRTPLRGRLGTGGTLRHMEAIMPPSSHRGHSRGCPARSPSPQWHEPVLDHNITFLLN